MALSCLVRDEATNKLDVYDEKKLAEAIVCEQRGDIAVFVKRIVC